MKMLSIIFGLILTFTLIPTPAFPVSLQFDFDGDPNTWETEWALSDGEIRQVDVWLANYTLGDDVFMVGYTFAYDTALLEVTDCWPYVSPEGPWNLTSSYAHCGPGEDGKYAVFSAGFPGAGYTVIGGKVKLHTIELKSIAGGDGQIQALGGSLFGGDFLPHTVDDASAIIHGPCVVSIDPSSAEVEAGETKQFSASNAGQCDNSTYVWEVTADCGSSIDAAGLYTAGDVMSDCSDTVTVTDTANGDIQDTATVNIESPLTIEPQDPTIGAGGSIDFQGLTGMCDQPTYTWSVEPSGGNTIGSTITAGNTIDAKGSYRAGRDFIICEEATDIVRLEADCNGVKKTAETTVTVTPCVVTISPESVEVETGKTIEFKADKNECCTNAPCYTWEVSAAGTTGNTTNTDAAIYTWSVNAAGATGNTGNTFVYEAGSSEGTYVVTVTDTCNNNSADTTTLEVISTPTTTTTTSTPPDEGGEDPTDPDPGPPEQEPCTSDDDCDDGSFCNGAEICSGEVCWGGSEPCPDDELFCNGDEDCDEEGDVCTNSGDPCAPGLTCDEDSDLCLGGCSNDADCNDDVFCNGVETCQDDGVCQPGSDPCPDDELFCNGEEICDEETDACFSSDDPCSPNETCDEEIDVCVPPSPPPPSFDLIPNQALRSHLIPLPLFMFIASNDPVTKFASTTTVSFSGDAITSPWTLVLSEDLIFTFSLISPAGLEATGSTAVDVTVTTDEGEGTATLNLNMLPFILDQKGNPI